MKDGIPVVIEGAETQGGWGEGSGCRLEKRQAAGLKRVAEEVGLEGSTRLREHS
jgi:hypothetical protein